MSKISRADSKARFRTGMYPTQADFENLHDSYVHKDDTIPLEQVGTNGATVVSLLNQKANSSHTHEIADVNGLQAFITKVNTFLGTVDASDDTINRWKEVEAFLTGITDTQTLTGLLANLRKEIVALIPEADTNSYLKLVPDLDAYTDAPDGEIVKYTGPTNDKYTRGWDYERVAGDLLTVSVPSGSKYIGIQEAPDEYSNLLGVKFYPTGRSIAAIGINAYGIYYYLQDTEPKVGDVVVRYSGYDAPGATITITEINDGVPTLSNGYPTTRTFADTWYEYVSTDGEYILVNIAPDTNLAGSTSRIYLSSPPSELVEFKLGFSNVGSGGFSFSLGSTPSSWRLIPSMPVIQ